MPIQIEIRYQAEWLYILIVMPYGYNIVSFMNNEQLKK